MGELKERREELGKTIEEIAKATRIKGSYLRAIEDGDFSKLPVEVYTKGYIREYARFLGVSSDMVIASYEAYIEEIKGPKEREAENTFLRKISPEDSETNDLDEYAVFQSDPESKGKSDAFTEKPFLAKLPVSGIARRVLVAFSLLIVIAAIVIYAALPGGKDAPPVMPKIEPGIQQETRIKEPEPPLPAQAQENAKEKRAQHVNPAGITPPSAPGGDKTEIANTSKKKHNLSISATDTVWIQLTIDGDDKKEMLLNAGETAFYEAYRSMNLVVGNAAGVKLKFNGKPLENLGEKGQVVRLDLPSTTIKKNEHAEKAVRPESQPPQAVKPSSL